MSAQLLWHVVQTLPNAENKAVAHLTRQGFETYLPRYLKWRRHARKVDSVAAPLFPRYLFVAVDTATQRWRAIQSTIGVSRLICNGNMPAPTATRIVDDLRRREDMDGYIHLQSGPRFTPGDAVRIVDGAFNSCVAIYEGMTGRERVAVLLELLGRTVRIVVDDVSVVAA